MTTCSRSITVLHAAGILILCIAVNAMAAGPETDAISRGVATEWGRVLERLLIVVAGSLSMYYGFRLFSIVSGNAGELAAQAGNWQLKLVRVGPGVFFAFFGATIVIYAMSQAPSIVTRDANGTPVSEIRGALVLPGLTEDTAAESLRALQTVSAVAVQGNAAGTPGSSELLQRAVDELEPVRQLLVNQLFGNEAYAEWSRLNDLQQVPGSSAFAEAMRNPQARQRYNKIDEFLAQRLE